MENPFIGFYIVKYVVCSVGMFIKRLFFLRCMDIKEMPTTQLLGDSILFFAPMNGGKTEALVQELKRAGFYNLNSIAYNHERNTRERNAIVVDGRNHYPAKTVPNLAALRQDFEERRRRVLSTRIGDQGIDGKITIEGVEHRKGHPLSVLGIDEVNLFCLNESEAAEMLDFMQWCKSEKIALYLSGLLYDFRHMEFGQVHAIVPYIDIRQDKKPACMTMRGGNKCTNTAKHTQRVWSTDFVTEVGLENLLSEMHLFDFVDKDKTTITGRYVAAPFFDQTLRIQEEKDKKVKYLPVCSSCAALPYKEETFRVYDTIVCGQNTGTLAGTVPLDPILRFLVQEKWIALEGERYTSINYHRNRLGKFSV